MPLRKLSTPWIGAAMAAMMLVAVGAYVIMTGSATYVFKGQADWDAFG